MNQQNAASVTTIAVDVEMWLCLLALAFLGFHLPLSAGSTGNNGGYILRLITPKTNFPMRLNDNNRQLGSRWYKYGCSCFVEEIDSYYKSYYIEPTMGYGNNLLILEPTYNRDFNFLVLDHYESVIESSSPFATNFETQSESRPSEIFTIGYLKSFALSVDDNQDSALISCKTSVLLPTSISSEQSDMLNDILMESLSMRLEHEGFSAEQTDRSKPKGRRRRRDSDQDAGLNEIEIVEGPIMIDRKLLRWTPANVSCVLNLHDYNSDVYYNQILHHQVLGLESPADNSSGSQRHTSGHWITLFCLGILLALNII